MLRRAISAMRARLVQGESGGVLRGMFVLALGTGAARLIGLLTIPWLARIYTPEDYGVLAVYTALVATLAPALTLRYVQAVPLPRTDAMAVNLLALCGALIVGTCILTALIIWLVSDVILLWMSMETLVPWKWLLLLGAAALATYEAGTCWATRKRAYSVISRTKLLQSAAAELTKITLGLLGFKPIGLLLGSIVEQGGGTSAYAKRFGSDLRALAQEVRFARIVRLLRFYRGFPLYRLPSQFLLALSTQAPAMLSAALYGAKSTGHLAFALMALAIPGNLIGQSAGQAFYGEIARLPKGSSQRIQSLVYAVQKRLFLFGVPVTLFIILLGTELFVLVFGDEWRDAGVYASILAPFVLLQLTSAPLVQVLNVLNIQVAFLIINIVRAIGLLAIYLLCLNLELGPKAFAAILSGFLFLFYLLVTIYILATVRNLTIRPTEDSR